MSRAGTDTSGTSTATLSVPALSRSTHVCASCGQAISPARADVVHAVELVRSEMLGVTVAPCARGVYFHSECFPYGSPWYRIEPNPGH